MSSSESNNSNNSNSLPELEKKLHDALETIEMLKKQGKTLLDDNSSRKKYEQIEKELQEKSLAYDELEKKLEQLKKEYNELKQENALFSEYIDSIESEKSETKKAHEKIKEKYEKQKQTVLEKEQEKLLLGKTVEIAEKEKHVATKKYYKTIIVSVIAIAVIAGAYSLLFAQLAGEQYRIDDPVNAPTGYVIQNLRGDVIDTWIAWRIQDGEVIHVTVSGAALTPERLELVKAVFLDEEPLEIDNSLLHKGPKGTTSIHYAGWMGALSLAAETTTVFVIPTKFEVTDKGGIGDINIKLESAVNPDGFSGWTSSIVDEVNNQILKSDITIYQTSDYTDNQFAAVLRHEIGHALGLAHSTAPEDLMAPTMTTEFPYISPCDIDAIVSLYDNGGHSTVTCEI